MQHCFAAPLKSSVLSILYQFLELMSCQRNELSLWVVREHGVKQLRCLGGFRNERSDYDFEGFKLELDKTMFAHGTVYEVEVETVRWYCSLNKKGAQNSWVGAAQSQTAIECC